MKRGAAALLGAPPTPGLHTKRPTRRPRGGSGEAVAGEQEVMVPPALVWTPASLAAAADRLAGMHPTLADLRARHGVPTARLLPLPPSRHFGTLARAIVGQQVSGAAAATIHGRVLVAAGVVEAATSSTTALLTPAAVAATPTDALRSAGLSGRKATYLASLAAAFSPPSGALAGVDLTSLDDAALNAALTALPGVGPWTAHMFAMFALGRPDVLATGDLGIRKGVGLVFGLGGGGSGGGQLPGAEVMERLTAPWAPHRSLACWWLWRLVGESEERGKGKGTVGEGPTYTNKK